MLKMIRKYKYLLTVILFVLIVLAAISTKLILKKNKYNNIDISSDNLEINDEILVNNDESKCFVDIKGAIKEPKVYEVECDRKIQDVIELAGGLTENADTSLINLAKKIENEMVIIVYTKDEVKNSNILETVVKTVEKECVCPNIQNDGCINNEIDGMIGENDNGLVNINTASVSLLQTLPGIGESKAIAIVKYREENGAFNTVEDIKNVPGIGEKLYEEIKAYITT